MLKPGDVEGMAEARDVVQMLDFLRNRSHIFNNLIDEPYCYRPYQMIDKTPGYVYEKHFERILKESHGAHVPVIVLKKNYWLMVVSRAKHKRHLPRALHASTYNVKRMIRKYPTRIMVVMQKVFDFVGLEWKTDYLKKTNLKKKFANYYGTGELNYIVRWEWKSHTNKWEIPQLNYSNTTLHVSLFVCKLQHLLQLQK